MSDRETAKQRNGAQSVSAESKRRIHLWLSRLRGWQAKSGSLRFRATDRPGVALSIDRHDDEHWSPFTGETLEHAAARMLSAHGRGLDKFGAETKE